MNAMLAGLAAVLLYVVAGTILSRQLFRREPPDRPLILALGALALPLHLVSIHTAIYQPAGLDLGLFHMVSLIGWLIAAMAIGMSLYQPVISLALGAFPLAILGILLSLFIQVPYTPQSTLSRGMESHILLSILAYSVLTIAAAQAILLAIQDRHLRLRKHGLLSNLPPLQTMERLLFSHIVIGFILLTLSILSGFITMDDMFAQHVVHKTILTLAAWLVFAILLVGRQWLGWRGTVAIRLTIWGFILLIVGYYGSKVVLELILHRPV